MPVKAIGCALLLLCAPLEAAEIVLEPSALQKLIEQALFKHEGRYVIQRGPCSAYLEDPSVTLRQGRIRIRSHLAGRLGAAVGPSCVGVAVASWAVVSGRPIVQGGNVRLVDLRVDEVEDPKIRFVLESGLVPVLPRAIEFDVLKAVRTMLQGSGEQIQGTVEAFSIDAIVTTDDAMSVKFDFRLVGR